LPFTCRGENEISENLFATTELRLQAELFEVLLQVGFVRIA